MTGVIPLWDFSFHSRFPNNAKPFEVIITHPCHSIPFWYYYLRRASYLRKNKYVRIELHDFVYLFLRRTIYII